MTIRSAVLLCACIILGSCYAEAPEVIVVETPEVIVVEASCGQCQLGLPGNGCDLAIRIDGKSYFVDGIGIDDHGDAHADDGFCNAIRTANVTGQIIDERFVASSFELVQAAKH